MHTSSNDERVALTKDPANSRRCVAIVSPFLDKRHGTERAVIECISRLAGKYEVHLYSQRVEDVDLAQIRWHRIPKLPGPHLVNFLWWFAANHIWRWWNRRFSGVVPDIVFSPGVNCLDADVVSVHIVFATFIRQVRSELALGRTSPWFWPRLLHRRLYYRLVERLEGHVYGRPQLALAAVSRRVADELARSYGHKDRISVIYHAFDPQQFSPQRRASLRAEARSFLGLDAGEFALLLIANDWKNKGLPCLIEAAGMVHEPGLRLFVVGGDDPVAFRSAIAHRGLSGQVCFLPPRPDVEFYYAAADAYVGPSLEDAFALPPAEAMACGLPVIISRNMGVSEIITHGHDGLILEDPRDSATLAGLIRQLMAYPELCSQLSQKAALTTRSYTWERNAQEIRDLIEQVHVQKKTQEKLRPREAS